jgi:selenocysteine-specific elongation factor
VSSLTGEGIADLRSRLVAAEAEVAWRDSTGRFRFAVDRSFTLAGTGTVVSGMVLGGRVALDDIVTVSPSGLRARVRGIHAQNRKAAEGLAGQRCALNLAGEAIAKELIHRGDMVLDPALHAPTDRIDVFLTVLASAPRPVDTWFPAHLHSHAAETGARVVPLQGPIGPGQGGLAQLVLDRPLAALSGDRFILRDTSAKLTLGGGRFLDLRPPARKRGTPDRLELLAAARETDAARALAGQAAVAPVDLSVFQRDRGLMPDSGLAERAGLVRLGDLALPPSGLQALREGLAETLAAFHAENPDLPGLGREKLRLTLRPRLSKPEFLLFLRAEAEMGQVVLDGAFLRLAGHEVRLSPEDEALYARILPHLLGDARFRPPRVRDLATELGVDEREVRRVLRLTQKLGRTDQIAQDHFFVREVTREMTAILREVAADTPDGWFTAPAFRDRLDNGRKVAIQILDFFDRLGFTLRRGDLRRINPHRLDLFG